MVFSVGLRARDYWWRGGTASVARSSKVAGDLHRYIRLRSEKEAVGMSSARGYLSDALREVASRFRGDAWPSRSDISSPPASPARVSKPRDQNKRPFPWKFANHRRPDPVALCHENLDASAASAGRRSDHLHCGHLHPDAAG